MSERLRADLIYNGEEYLCLGCAQAIADARDANVVELQAKLDALRREFDAMYARRGKHEWYANDRIAALVSAYDALAARHDSAVRLAGSWHRAAMSAAEKLEEVQIAAKGFELRAIGAEREVEGRDKQIHELLTSLNNRCQYIAGEPERTKAAVAAKLREIADCWSEEYLVGPVEVESWILRLRKEADELDPQKGGAE